LEGIIIVIINGLIKIIYKTDLRRKRRDNAPRRGGCPQDFTGKQESRKAGKLFIIGNVPQ
jgi:hypothetical protein